MAGLQTEFEFTLPKGFVDNQGNLHRKGTMKLATALDEIAPLKDPRVRANQAYLTIILLGRVITKLGTLTYLEITADVIERLFASDLAYLQAMYNRINSSTTDLNTVCPTCGRPFEHSTEEEGQALSVGG